MAIDAEACAEIARRVIAEKVNNRWPSNMKARKELDFEQLVVREFADRVLPQGYAGLIHFPADGEGKPS